MKKDKKEYPVTLFEKYEIEKTIINEIDNINSKTLKDCRDKCFHSFKNTKYDINFTNVRKNKKVDVEIEKRGLKKF